MIIELLLVLAAVALLTGLIFAPRTAHGWLGSLLLGTTSALAAASAVLITGKSWEWWSVFRFGGEQIHLRLDGVSALFLALLAILGGVAGAYSRDYWRDAEHSRSAPAGRALWCLLLLCIGLVLLASNGLIFLIAWELFAVVAFFLITLDARRCQVREAGWLYLAASHAGTLSLFAFFSLLAFHTGGWDLGPQLGSTELAPLFWLALLGFGVKAGAFPLHIWLPSAHANAPSHVSAILSGVAIKMGIYGIVRFSGWLPTPSGAGWVVILLGASSAVLGVAFALGQHDLKRLLAYHSVENIGIILVGVGFAMVATAQGHATWGALALAGGLLHVWNHGLFKALLFLGAGGVLHATGSREMSQLGGLWRGMPWTASLFALGAVAISGLPPLNGFVSEWLIYVGMFDAMLDTGNAAVAAIACIVLLAVTGALALACFVKVCGVVFLGAARSPGAARARECGVWMRGAMLTLAAGCVTIGLAPLLFWPTLHAALTAWRGTWLEVQSPSSLPALSFFHASLATLGVLGAFWFWRRAGRHGWVQGPTWDCGYAAPTARMQYTAGSFAAMITEWFSWILMPERRGHRPEGTHPGHAGHWVHTPETVLDRVIEPTARGILWLSETIRKIEQAQTQLRLFCLILGLIGAAAMVVVWEP